MSFRLKRAKGVGAQLLRIAGEELRSAIDEVKARTKPRDAASIHEARKHLKKIRSLLRLLRGELGAGYTSLNRLFRSAARRLSPLRDADAIVESLKALKRQYPKVITPAVFRQANGVLAARRQDAHARLARSHFAGVARSLRRSLPLVRSRIRRAATRGSMQDGVKRGYRRARKAMADATSNREELRLHIWRRRVKDHWYHMRLVEGFDKHAQTRVRRLKELDTWLGDDHNLVVLKAAILEEPYRFGDAHTVALILGCIDKHQTMLRRRAVHQGRQLFSSKPGSFRKQISRWWS